MPAVCSRPSGSAPVDPPSAGFPPVPIRNDLSSLSRIDLTIASRTFCSALPRALRIQLLGSRTMQARVLRFRLTTPHPGALSVAA